MFSDIIYIKDWLDIKKLSLSIKKKKKKKECHALMFLPAGQKISVSNASADISSFSTLFLWDAF